MSDSNFLPSVNHLLKDEKGILVTDDNGRGPSKWGITWETAQAVGFLEKPETIATLTRDQAIVFYRRYLWDEMHLSLLSSLPLASRLLNLGVNIGPATAIHWLQRTINSLNMRVKDDGVLGPKTAAVANAMGSDALLNGIKTRAKLYYESLAAQNPVYAKDLAGWLNRLKEADV